MKKWSAFAVVVVVLFTAGILLYAGGGAVAGLSGAATDEEPVEVLPPVTVDPSVIAEAVVVPQRSAGLSMPVGGIVAAVYVQEGDIVAAGQALVQLDDARARTLVAQLEATLRQAEFQLADLKSPADPEQVAQAQAALDATRARLQKVQDGPTSGEITIARADLAGAEAAVRQAQAAYDDVAWRNDVAMLPQAAQLEQATQNYVAAQARLDDLLAGASAADVAAASAEVRSAQSALDELLSGPTAETIAASEAGVAAAHAALDDARTALEQMLLKAPFAGQVAALNFEVGEQVAPGAVVVNLADATRWRLETEDLTELAVVRVAPGDFVEIAIDALPDLKLNGRVARVRPLGEDKLGDITYAVLIEMDEQDSRLRWNMTAQVTIRPDKAARVVAQSSQSFQDLLAEGTGSAHPDNITPLPPVNESMAATPEEPSTFAAPRASDATDSAAVAPVEGIVNTRGVNLNVRSGPSTQYGIIGVLKPRTVTAVTARNADGTWLRIDLDGAEGWVSAAFLIVDDSLTGLPVADKAVEAQPGESPPGQPSPAKTASAPESVAPTSGVLVFQTCSGGDIMAYDVATGVLWRLTYGADPAISPDGRTVAFVRGGGEHGLYLIGIDGNNERRIFGGGEELRAPTWSPDGQQIAFTRKTGTYDCRSVGAGLCLPDSEFLTDFPLVEQTETSLGRVDVNGRNFQDVPSLDTAAAPSWGIDGIAYQSRAGLQMTSNGPGMTTQPVADGYRLADPAWHPDGSRLVFHSLEGNHREIGVVDAGGANLRLVTRPTDLLAREYPQNVAPVWSPDGHWIAFLSNRTGNGGVGSWAVWVMDANGGNIQQLPVVAAIAYGFGSEQVLSWGTNPT